MTGEPVSDPATSATCSRIPDVFDPRYRESSGVRAALTAAGELVSYFEVYSVKRLLVGLNRQITCLQ